MSPYWFPCGYGLSNLFEKTRPVVVARRNLRKLETIALEDVELVEFPASSIRKGMVFDVNRPNSIGTQGRYFSPLFQPSISALYFSPLFQPFGGCPYFSLYYFSLLRIVWLGIASENQAPYLLQSASTACRFGSHFPQLKPI